MAMRKYTKSESFETVDPKAHTKIAGLLSKLGKKSAADLTDQERDELRKASKEDPET